jgi:hypothetical protein
MASNQPTFTGFEPEMQDISRQRDLAKMLLQKGMADNLSGQMVSGRYVGASPLQGIANLYSAYKGKQLAEESDTKQAELAQKLRQVQSQEAQDILGALRGTPEQTVYGAGMEGPTMTVTPAVEGSQQAALAKALSGRSPFSQTMATKLMEQQFKEPKWEKVEQYDEKTGNTITGMVNVNSSNPESTFRKIAVSKPALSPKDIAELRDKGISIPVGGGAVVAGGGAPTGGVSMGGGATTPKVTGDAKYMPSTLPTYEYDPSLSPAQNREMQAKFAEDLRKNVKNAKDAFGTIKSVSDILRSNAPSSGRLENIVTGTREFFGGGGEQSKADAQLKVLGQKLVQQVPRFEGPQSDKDVASYQAAAGDIGNPNMPIASRLAALQTLVDLNKKYYPNGDWDSINLAAPKIKPNMLGGTNTYFGAKVEAPETSGWRVKP